MRFEPRVFSLAGRHDALSVLMKLGDERGLVALDSAAGAPRRWSVVGFDPIDAGPPPPGIAALRAWMRQLELGPGDAIPGPFHAGFLGALAYDLGVEGERGLDLPRDPWATPLVVGGLYTRFVVIEELHGRAWLVLSAADAESGRAAVLRARLEAGAPSARPAAATGPGRRSTSSAVHAQRIEHVRASISAGDLYQANLCHRSTCDVHGRAIDLYARLRTENPAPFMAYLAWDPSTSSGSSSTPRGALLSASPELLLEFDGRTARTRPIKGTAPRGATPELDRASADALRASAKDQAELAMIVDLERNDLGRCALPGGVHVENFPRLETYASVHHLTADVVAEIRKDLDAFDVLAALFPGGSITGAPKVASMKLLGRLEGEGRGFFTGSLGFVDLRGQALWNILIRTIVWRPSPKSARGTAPVRGSTSAPLAPQAIETSAPVEGEVSFHVGGGITWASRAEAEDLETGYKAEALLRALGTTWGD